MPRNAARTGIPLAFFLVAILSLAALQTGLQRVFEERYPSRRIENLLYLPTGENLKVMSLGFRSLLADALWVKAIGYFGGHNLTDREYPWLHHILDTVTTLDPLFRHPYLFGGIVLGVEEGDPAKSIHLLRKGMSYYSRGLAPALLHRFQLLLLSQGPGGRCRDTSRWRPPCRPTRSTSHGWRRVC